MNNFSSIGSGVSELQYPQFPYFLYIAMKYPYMKCCCYTVIALSCYTVIFSVKYWRDLEIWASGWVITVTENGADQIDRSYTTLYRSAVVTIALSCTIFELFDVENIMTLKSQLGVIDDHWKWHHSIDCIRVPISLQPKCGHILYRFRNKARYWSKNTNFSYRLYLTCTVP